MAATNEEAVRTDHRDCHPNPHIIHHLRILTIPLAGQVGGQPLLRIPSLTAGANELNERVWAPPFGLPSITSLLRIVDGGSLMSDLDMGNMFHNFPLDESTGLYTANDLAPLRFELDICKHCWVCWKRNLMGFRSSPYNSIRIYLVAEEIIRGDRHDETNAFRLSRIMLNLPGTEGYKPSLAWITN